MINQPADIDPHDRRTNPSPVAWVVAVALLAAALAGAVTVAVHYRSEVATLQQLRAATGRHSLRAVPMTLGSTAVKLPSRGTLSGGVTILTAKAASGLTQVALSARISGARPNTGYALFAFNCEGSSGYQTWAAGVTNAHGSGSLSGEALSVSPRNEYWLYLSSSSGASSEAGIRGRFTAAGKFSAFPAGDPACP